ncbi:MAG: MerR family transcriptional regulator [Bacteroidales bacterium]|nr:MerR family transcriptional regulator [Bacteroidales bacterium]
MKKNKSDYKKNKSYYSIPDDLQESDLPVTREVMFTLKKNQLYYSIAEVSMNYGLPYSTLRYWESEFKELKPKRNKRGVRFYRKEDLEVLDKIFFLIKQENYTIEGAKKAMKAEKNKESNSQKLLNNLLDARVLLWNLRNKITDLSNGN